MRTRDFWKSLLLIGAITAGAATIGEVYVMNQYADLPGFGQKVNYGRQKNSLAVLVGGIVAQKAYGKSSIDLDVQKKFWPDTEVKGTASKDYIDTRLDVLFSSAEFKAKMNPDGKLEGRVDKSEFDWKVKQLSENIYEVGRWGLKLDAKLELEVKDGKITGRYVPKIGLNYQINGTYDSQGNVKCEIDRALGMGITLDGKITQK